MRRCSSTAQMVCRLNVTVEARVVSKCLPCGICELQGDSAIGVFNVYFNFPLPVNINPQLNKGKAVPLHAWSGPEGCRKVRFPDYMTTAQDGGKFVSLTLRPPLSPGNAPGTHFC
jgi:hypothetical protein